jgi:YYY domain-containing protein
MADTLFWYIITTVIGLAAFPLAFRLLPGLADRGYTVSRALGLLLTGYLFWLSGSLGLLNNSVGGILLCGLVMAGVGLWIYFSQSGDDDDHLLSWVSGHRRFITTAELLYLLAFVGWAVVRAYNPDISGTEKPMDLAFLNGIRTSPTLPPHDPWLSGYAISYYYFGYLIMAMLADLGGSLSAVSFNLAIALLFALTLLGSYGLVYNLAAATTKNDPDSAVFSALLGPLFVGVMGNLAGFFELLHALNPPLFGARFWRWLDIVDLNEPAVGTLWPPSSWRYWWWWRASRVIHDRTIAGESFWYQPIDEFPMFSFLLGDMHPHVLALPFVLLALGLAFNLIAQQRRLSPVQLGAYAVCYGGLAFLNTWDFPTALFILIGALVIRQITTSEKPPLQRIDFGTPVLTGAAMLALGIALYLPWYISFSSQAGGILPNAFFPTRLHQFGVMFGPFLVIIVWFLLDEARQHHRIMSWTAGAAIGGMVLFALIALMAALSYLALRVDPTLKSFVLGVTGVAAETLPGEAAAGQLAEAVQITIRYRLQHPLTALFLTGTLILALARVLPRHQPEPPNVRLSGENTLPRHLDQAAGFALLLVITGLLLTLGPEYLYLRDVFGQRFNTIFKFYYAAWVLFGIAAAFMATRLARRPLFNVVVTVLVLAGLVYPAFAIPSRMGSLLRTAGEPAPTLDGLDFVRRSRQDDYDAIFWLAAHAAPDEIVLEAVGGQYSYYGRVSAFTGLQTVMGWPGHERQWRGERYPDYAGTREEDVREIYNTTSIMRAMELLEKYGVTYVYVGQPERIPDFASPAGIAKFSRYLTPAYQNDTVTIYRIDQAVVEEGP